MHLTEEELNEYLDNETQDSQRIELHLSVCDECAARLSTLRALFTEIESLPELALTRNISEAPQWGAAPFTRDRNLRLAVTLQAALALLAIILAAPFVIEFVSPYLANLPTPSLTAFTDVFIQIQSQWMSWLDMLSNFRLTAAPPIPAIDLSSLAITFTLVVVSMLWLVGNGLLLRNQIK